MFIHRSFEAAANLYSSSPAVTYNEQTLSYADLDQLANRLAAQLIKEGVLPGDIIGVSLDRSIDLIAGVLAILKVGAAYLPLDPEYPLDRINYMVRHSRVRCILLHRAHIDFFSSSKAKLLIFENLIQSSVQVARPVIDETKINLCYVIYTSGSTGNPKGVALGHKALSNLISWQNEQTRIKEDLRTLQFTPLSFDVHFQEIFSTLTTGGHLILISEEVRLNPMKLLKTISDYQIGRIFLPYVALNQLAEVAQLTGAIPACLKEITTAGEQLKITPALVNFFTSLEGAVLYNHYGPSESHVVTSHTLSGNPTLWPGLPPIGKPISLTKVLLLDENLNPVAFNEEGEIYLSGICLADGYLNDVFLTQEKFFDHPVHGRLYKTGDLGTKENDGVFTYLGRKDGQVKIRGYRIETGEIELHLQRQNGVQQGVVKVIVQEGDKILCAYFTGTAEASGLRAGLKKSLPEYMIPSHFIKLDALPLSPSGKVDYKALQNPSRERPELMNEYIAPRTELEVMVAKLWKKNLALDSVGVKDNFFDLGGNSLLAIRILVEINQLIEKEISVVDFFQNPTISLLGSIISGEESKAEAVPSPGLRKLTGDIAVIGVAGRFPGAENVEEFWSNLVAGKNSIERFRKEELNPLISPELSESPDYLLAQGVYPGQKSFDYKFFGMTPRESELMDPQQRKFLELSVEALENAGYYSESNQQTIGIFAGMGNSKYGRLVDQYPDKVQQAGEFNVMLGLEKDYLATRVAYKLNLTGPAISLNTGCSTSLVSIIEASKSLRLNECSMALAGGISISGAPNSGHLFQEGGILSRDGLCKPFDENATGTVFTDGAGIVVLRRFEDALRDGDNILGVIKGLGLNNDGAQKMSFTAPSAQGQLDAIRKAYLDGDIDPQSIGYIEAHGTATPVGDPIEFSALKQAFGNSKEDKKHCYLSSVKSNIGHLTAAAGVVGFIKALLVVNRGIVPGTVNFTQTNKLIDLESSPFLITSDTIALDPSEVPRRAGVSSFGVGGTNAHVVLEQYVGSVRPEVSSADDSATLFKLSAKSELQLNQMEQSLLGILRKSSFSEWKKIGFTLEVGRKDYPFRRYLSLSPKNDLSKMARRDTGRGHFTQRLPLTMMFPGQGSQYICMGKGFYESSMIFRAEFDRCTNLFQEISGYNLKDLLFEEINTEKLNNTFFAQPALFVIEYCLARTYIELGFTPDLLVGHSVGEYVAATLAGIFSLTDGLRIIAKRAELISKLPLGSMISVCGSKDQVLILLDGYELDVAAVNGPSSTVVSGAESEVLRLQIDLTDKGIGSILLKTSHAFHSRMMKPVVLEFKKFLDLIEKSTPSIPLLSSISLKTNDLELLTSAYWAEHIVECVLFSPTMHEQLLGKATFYLEIGPKNILTNLLRKQAKTSGLKDFHVSASMSDSPTLENAAFLRSIGELWVAGLKMKDAHLLYRSSERMRTAAPVYVFEKNHVWLDTPNFKSKLNTTFPVELTMKSPAKNLELELVKLFEKSSGIDVGDYGSDVTFLEMGMDSLFLTQISLQLKKELKIQVSFRQLLEEYSTISSLAEAFKDKIELEVPREVLESVVPQQSQVQQLSQLQSVNQTQIKMPTETATGIEGIIQKQIDLMNQQLLLLRGIVPETAAPERILKKNSRGADIRTAKDSFGAAPKINIEKAMKFDPLQNKMIQDFFAEYIFKTQGSKKFTQENRRTHADPRVVTGFKPENKEIVYPIVVNKSSQQYLWDIDGNKYIDMTCGFGSNFFGNGNERIKKLVTKQLEEGIEIGPQHELVGEVSRLVCELTGNDRAAFCNTGSEAVLGAMRIARTVTGREKIIVFSGSYHGINDEVIIRSARDHSYPAAPGINESAVSNMIVLDYGTEESLKLIREMASDVAAVLVEPVQSRRCNFHPVAFLKELRNITEASQTCLIFDEVITGFRIHPAGAQGYFGIRADLCTYGKIVGGGMPIGVVSGKTEYMDALDGGFWQYGDESTPTVGVTYFAGTFVRHPLALAAAKGALEIIKEGGIKMLADLNERAQKFADEINAFCTGYNIPLEMHNFGALMKPKWGSEVPGSELFFAILRLDAVHVYDGFPWFINLAHTENDLQLVMSKMKAALIKMQSMGLIPNSVKINAPICARPGRDQRGNPASFIEDSANPGDYFLIEQ